MAGLKCKGARQCHAQYHVQNDGDFSNDSDYTRVHLRVYTWPQISVVYNSRDTAF